MMRVVLHPLHMLQKVFQAKYRRGTKMLDYRKLWRHLANTKQIQSHHVVQYAILRALETTDGDIEKSKKIIVQYLAKAFTPIKRQIKLDNGLKPFGALVIAICNTSVLNTILDAPFKALDEKYQSIYKELVHWLVYSYFDVEEYYKRHYVYIFVRQDLPPAYQLVQAAHVALKAGYQLATIQKDDVVQLKNVTPDGLYFTVIGVRDDSALNAVKGDLDYRGLKYWSFLEPDIGNQVTAVATMPIPARERGDLMKHKLLTL